MLLGNRRKQNEEQNWSLVLSPLRNEIDKKKVAAKISEVFSLSLEESFDLTANTPIILLDNLSRKVAIQVKEFFSTTGADMVLTNDVFYKRKCYRTVWPEPPNLAFLNKEIRADNKIQTEQGKQEKLKAAEALSAMRAKESAYSQPAVPNKTDDSLRQQKLVDELEHWRRECQERRLEVEKLHQDLSNLQNSKPVISDSDKEIANEALRQKDQTIDQLRNALADSETKYRSLREEYKQARSIFEDKLLRANQSHDSSSDKTKMLEDRVKGITEKNRDLEFQLAKLKQELMTAEEQKGQQSSEKEERLKQAIAGFESEKRKNIELENQIGALRQSGAGEKNRLEELEAENVKVREERDLAKLKLEDVEKRWDEAQIELGQLRTKGAELDALKLEFEALRRDNGDSNKKLNDTVADLTDRCKVLSETNEKQQIELNRKREELELMVQKNQDLEKGIEIKNESAQELERQFLNLEKAFQQLRAQSSRQEKHLNEKQIVLEEKIKETNLIKQEKEILNQSLLDAQQMLEVQNTEFARLKESFNDEINRKDEELTQMRTKIGTLEQLVQGLKSEFEDLHERFAAKDTQLTARERETESLRRQMKDLKAQLDQKDLISRRTQLNSAMVEKEDMLKQLVAEQKRIEIEIREREDIMRRVLSKQESVEKELMDVKQTQRHLLEQAKKEQKNLTAAGGDSEQSNQPSVTQDSVTHD